jgi:hypothetical protein
MKKTSRYILPFLISLIVIQGCKKDDTSPTDKTMEEILTSNPWRMDEIRFLQNNTPYYYKRGAAGNSMNFDTDVITFKSDKTGTYVGDGITYTLTWDFTDVNKNKVKAIVNYPTAVTLNLENISYTNTLLKYTEYYTRAGVNTLSSVSRTP